MDKNYKYSIKNTPFMPNPNIRFASPLQIFNLAMNFCDLLDKTDSKTSKTNPQIFQKK